jgi:hypothetical protein
LIWAKSLSCGGNTFVGDVYCDDYSNVYVCGFFGHASAATELNCEPFVISGDAGMHLFIIKYAPNGNVFMEQIS